MTHSSHAFTTFHAYVNAITPQAGNPFFFSLFREYPILLTYKFTFSSVKIGSLAGPRERDISDLPVVCVSEIYNNQVPLPHTAKTRVSSCRGRSAYRIGRTQPRGRVGCALKFRLMYVCFEIIATTEG